jgi:pimeloyl-ACP methyl ester carboxylesterase
MKIAKIGQGRCLLYLHGWGFDSQVWYRQIDYFRPRYCNWLIDYNRVGPLGNITHEDLFEHLCAELLPMLQAMPEPPLAIIANGLGAFVAYELIERGLLPEKLILCGGLVRFTNGQGYLSGISHQKVAGMRRALRRDVRRMLLGYYQFLFSGRGESPPQDLVEGMPLTAREFLLVAFDALISHDYQELLPKLPCPTLVVHGRADRAAPVWQAQALRRLLPASALYLCREAGHLPFVTRYASVNRVIAGFLEAQGGPHHVTG